MPLIYRRYCSKCHGSGMEVSFQGFAGAYVNDEREGGEIIVGEYLAYLNEANEIIPLPHPLELDTLKEQGVGWRKAQSQGRLLNITNLVCLDCGNLNEDVSVCLRPWSGCLFGVLAVGCYFLLTHFLSADSWLPIILSLAVFFLPQVFGLLKASLMYRDRGESLRFKGCKNCGSMRYVKVKNAGGMNLTCPTCGEAKIKISTAGIS